MLYLHMYFHQLFSTIVNMHGIYLNFAQVLNHIYLHIAVVIVSIRIIVNVILHGRAYNSLKADAGIISDKCRHFQANKPLTNCIIHHQTIRESKLFHSAGPYMIKYIMTCYNCCKNVRQQRIRVLFFFKPCKPCGTDSKQSIYTADL